MSEDMFDVFRGTVKANYLDDNVIDLIHERYMVLVHIDENARSTIHAALQRAWVEKTLRVPITRQNERLLLKYKRLYEVGTRNVAMASRNADCSARQVMVTRARILQDQQDPHGFTDLDETLLVVDEQRAASDAAEAFWLGETAEKRAAYDAVRATEIARIGPMMKIPDWVDAVVFFT